MCFHVIDLVIVVNGQCGGREREFDITVSTSRALEVNLKYLAKIYD